MSHTKPTTPSAIFFEMSQIFSLLAFVAAMLLWSSGTLPRSLALAMGVILFILPCACLRPHPPSRQGVKRKVLTVQAARSPSTASAPM